MNSRNGDLYALGMEDFNKQKDALAAFMTE